MAKGLEQEHVTATPAQPARRGSLQAYLDAGGSVSRQQYLIYGFFFKVRGLMMVLSLVAMFFITYHEGQNLALNWAIGLALFVAAVGLRIRSQQFLRYRLSEDGGLASDGPYSHVRNPVYIANSTGLAGLCILCGLYWLAALAAVWAMIVYHLAVQFEEIRLTVRFGDPYREYLKRVPRWLPRLTPAPGSGVDHVGVLKAARVEWQNLLLLLIPIGKLWVWGSQGGKAQTAFTDAVNAVTLHTRVFLVVLAIVLAAAAAWNLIRLRTAVFRKAKAQTQVKGAPQNLA